MRLAYLLMQWQQSKKSQLKSWPVYTINFQRYTTATNKVFSMKNVDQ